MELLSREQTTIEDDISVTIISSASEIDEDEQEPSISSMEAKRIARAYTKRIRLKRAKTC